MIRKPTQNCHTRPILFYCQTNGYTRTLHYHSVSIKLGWLVCFSRATFAYPVNSWLRQSDGTHGGDYMEGMGLKFTPGMGRRLLRNSSMFGPLAGSSGTYCYPSGPYGWFSPPLASHPPPPPAPSPSHPPTPYNVPSVILEWFWKKVAQKPAVLAS